VASFLYLEPLITLGAAVWLLGERISLTTVAGGLLVLAGVALVQREPEARIAAAEGAEGAVAKDIGGA
jgi:drug/metabolite transporter (DMT)-like permease